MNKKKIVFVVILVLLVAVLVYLFANQRIKGWYVDQIDYDMEIKFRETHPQLGGFAHTSNYVLINTQSKTAHYISHYNIYAVNYDKNRDRYTIKKFKLSDAQVNLLIEYANKDSEEINRDEFDSNTGLTLIKPNEYLEIEYNNKTTILNESSAQEILNFIDER